MTCEANGMDSVAIQVKKFNKKWNDLFIKVANEKVTHFSISKRMCEKYVTLEAEFKKKFFAYQKETVTHKEEYKLQEMNSHKGGYMYVIWRRSKHVYKYSFSWLRVRLDNGKSARE